MDQKSRIIASLLLLCIVLTASSCASQGPKKCDDKGPQLGGVNIVVDHQSPKVTVKFDVTNLEKLKHDPIVVFVLPVDLEQAASYRFSKTFTKLSNEWKKYLKDSQLKEKENYLTVAGVANNLHYMVNSSTGSVQFFDAAVIISPTYLRDPSSLNKIGSSVIIYGEDCIMVSKNQP